MFYLETKKVLEMLIFSTLAADNAFNKLQVDNTITDNIKIRSSNS
jgi:hypothetical protein